MDAKTPIRCDCYGCRVSRGGPRNATTERQIRDVMARFGSK